MRLALALIAAVVLFGIAFRWAWWDLTRMLNEDDVDPYNPR